MPPKVVRSKTPLTYLFFHCGSLFMMSLIGKSLFASTYGFILPAAHMLRISGGLFAAIAVWSFVLYCSPGVYTALIFTPYLLVELNSLIACSYTCFIVSESETQLQNVSSFVAPCTFFTHLAD